MTSSGAAQVNAANALPIRLVMLATLLALALIARMGWAVWNSVQVFREGQTRTFRVVALSGEIVYLNECVWASARLRMSTGEDRWLDRYGAMLAQRNKALAEFRELAPHLYDSPAASELRSANEKLAAMEAQAFAPAATLQLGDEYDRQKQISVDATAQLARDLSASADAALDFQRRRGRTVVTTVAVAVLLLLFTWVTSLKISAGQNAQRLRGEADRAEQARLAAFVYDVREALTKADSLGRILQSCANARVRHLDPARHRL